MSEDTQPTGLRAARKGRRRSGRRRPGRNHRRARTGRRRGACHPARRPAAARRARLLLPARRTHRGQRTACVSALLHRLPVVPRPHRGASSRPCRIVSTCPFSTPRRNPGGGSGESAAARCPYLCISRAAWRPISICRSRSAPRSAVPRWRSKRSISTIPPSTTRTSANGSPSTVSRSVPSRHWDLVGVATSTRWPATPRSGSPRWCSRPVCCPTRARPTSAGHASRWANCTTPWPARRSTPRACVPKSVHASPPSP